MSDDQKANLIAGRQWGKCPVHHMLSSITLTLKKTMTVTDWLNWYKIYEDDRLAYPNARTAYEIQQSPLAKALA